MENYTQFRERYVNKCRNNSNFRLAVEEMDNFIADPQKYRSNAVARVIRIKTEKEIQKHLGIKVEVIHGACGGKNEEKSDTLCGQSKIEVSMKEKNNLIDKIVSLKSENQRISFELNERKMELITMRKENEQIVRKLNDKIIAISLDLKNAEAAATKLKDSLSKKHVTSERIITDLITEKKK